MTAILRAAFTMGVGTWKVGFSHQITMILAGPKGSSHPILAISCNLSEISDRFPLSQEGGPDPRREGQESL
jgi:hypothetical protein